MKSGKSLVKVDVIYRKLLKDGKILNLYVLYIVEVFLCYVLKLLGSASLQVLSLF